MEPHPSLFIVELLLGDFKLHICFYAGMVRRPEVITSPNLRIGIGIEDHVRHFITHDVAFNSIYSKIQ